MHSCKCPWCYAVKCPFCGGSEVARLKHFEPIIGDFSKTWVSDECKECGQHFNWELVSNEEAEYIRKGKEISIQR